MEKIEMTDLYRMLAMLNQNLEVLQRELRQRNEIFEKSLREFVRLGDERSTDTSKISRRHGHCLTDEKLLELLEMGMTTPEIAEWTAKQGFRYSTPGIRKRINKLLREGKTTHDGKAKRRVRKTEAEESERENASIKIVSHKVKAV